MPTFFRRSVLFPCLAMVAVACSPAEAPPDESEAMPPAPEVVVTGLNGPIGVLVADDGTIYVSDSGTGGDQQVEMPWPGLEEPVTVSWGDSARILSVAPDGSETVLATLPSLQIPEGFEGTARLVMFDGALYAASGAWGEIEAERPPHMATVVRIADGTVTDYADTWAYEDRENPEPAHKESSPFDLTVGPDNALWLADSAGNTLFRINPETQELELKATFETIPGPIPNAARGGAMEIEPVPTAVAFDADGNVYVSLLRGVPFLPGTSGVVQVAADGTVSDYATDLTMLTDLVTGPDGQLYGVSLGEFTEQGPTPSSGALLRIGPGTTSEPILTGLSIPSSVFFTAAGDAYITVNAMGEPGTGQVVKYAGLISID